MDNRAPPGQTANRNPLGSPALAALSKPRLGTAPILWGEGQERMAAHGRGKTCTLQGQVMQQLAFSSSVTQREKPRDHFMVQMQKPKPFPGEVFQQSSQRSSGPACPKPKFPNQEAFAASNRLPNDASLFTSNMPITGNP